MQAWGFIHGAFIDKLCRARGTSYLETRPVVALS